VNNLKNYTRSLNNPIIQQCNHSRKLQRPVNDPNGIILLTIQILNSIFQLCEGYQSVIDPWFLLRS